MTSRQKAAYTDHMSSIAERVLDTARMVMRRSIIPTTLAGTIVIFSSPNCENASSVEHTGNMSPQTSATESYASDREYTPKIKPITQGPHVSNGIRDVSPQRE